MDSVTDQAYHGVDEVDVAVVADSVYFLPLDTADTAQENYYPRAVSDSVINGYRKEEAFWYANYDFNKEAAKAQGSPFFIKGWFRKLLWILLVVVFAGVLIWYLRQNNTRLFSRSDHPAGTEREEETAEDIFSINYSLKIEKAVSAGNYRLAVRFLFLRLLRDMSRKNIISFRPDMTNADYLSQLIGSGHYTRFSELVRIYEYAWYGGFYVSGEKYERIRQTFEIKSDQFNRTD